MSSPTAPEAPLFNPESDKLYTTKDVAEMFAVTSETVRDWIGEGKLPAIRLGSGHLRVKQTDVVAFANHRFGPGEAVTE